MKMLLWALIAASLLVTGCGDDDDSGGEGRGGGLVAADEARIEMTFTDRGTSFVGDHEIIEGTAVVVFSNETTAPVTLEAFGYDTGSAALAEELAFLQEGESGVPSGVDPVTPTFDTGLLDEFEPGSHTLTLDLQPGTYVFDVAPGDVMTAGLWRAAVIEVVAE